MVNSQHSLLDEKRSSVPYLSEAGYTQGPLSPWIFGLFFVRDNRKSNIGLSNYIKAQFPNETKSVVSPKPIASCAMPAAEGMNIKTNTTFVEKARKERGGGGFGVVGGGGGGRIRP